MNSIKKNLTFALLLAFTVTFTSNTYGQSDLPSPKVLFSKHIEAVGGEDALRAHQERTINGKLIVDAYGIKGDLTMVAEAPNKTSTTIDLGQFGTSKSGYNGTTGWSMDPMAGNRILEGEALQEMIKSADFYADNLNLGKGALEQETVGTVEFEDGEHYRVLVILSNGEESYMYFSKETGLLTGMDRMQSGAMGRVPTEIRLSDYAEFDGIKTAKRISSTQNGVETIIEIDSISYEPLPENAFELPAEIQALTKD